MENLESPHEVSVAVESDRAMYVNARSPENEQNAYEYIQSKFEDQQINLEIEREKTFEENEMLEGVVSRLPDFIESYGGKSVKLNSQHFHIFDREKLTEKETIKVENLKMRGSFNAETQRMYIDGSIDDPLHFTEVAVHEAVHFNTFQSFEENEHGELDLTMVGIDAEGEKRKEGYMQLNEAITAELTKRFLREHIDSIPHASDAKQECDRTLSQIFKLDLSKEEENFFSDVVRVQKTEAPNGYKKCTFERYGQAKHRQMLYFVMEDIRQYYADYGEEIEDPFQIFVSAAMSGDTQGLEDVIDSVYGPGSYERMGDDFIGFRPQE